MATSTPWGASQFSKRIARGITMYSTAGHGGLKVSAGRLADMHPALVNMGFGGLGNKGWFEEDASWCAVALAFPECFDANTVEAAHKTAQSWYSKLYNEAIEANAIERIS